METYSFHLFWLLLRVANKREIHLFHVSVGRFCFPWSYLLISFLDFAGLWCFLALTVGTFLVSLSRWRYPCSRWCCSHCTSFESTAWPWPLKAETPSPGRRWAVTAVPLGHTCDLSARPRGRATAQIVRTAPSLRCGTTSGGACAAESAVTIRWWRPRAQRTLTASASANRGTTTRRSTTCASHTARVHPDEECGPKVECAELLHELRAFHHREMCFLQHVFWGVIAVLLGFLLWRIEIAAALLCKRATTTQTSLLPELCAYLYITTMTLFLWHRWHLQNTKQIQTQSLWHCHSSHTANILCNWNFACNSCLGHLTAFGFSTEKPTQQQRAGLL